MSDDVEKQLERLIQQWREDVNTMEEQGDKDYARFLRAKISQAESVLEKATL